MNNDEKNNNLSDYKSRIGLTEKRMNFGLWFVSNRKRLLVVLIAILSLVAFVSWSNTIYNFARYYFVGTFEDEIIVREGADTTVTRSQYVNPVDLKIGDVKVIKNDHTVDFIAQVDNVNKEHWAHFSYSFQVGGFESDVKNGFVLPGESKYLIILSQESNSTRLPKLNLSNLSWTRVSKHEYPDWDQFVSDRMNIDVVNSGFLPAKSSGLSEKINLGLLSFDVENNSPFNYWDVGLSILLYARGQLVAVNAFALNEFESGESRSVKISMPGAISGVSKIEIIPEIDLTRDDIYMKFKGYSQDGYRD